MKILVTGAGGFLGTHIAKILIESGHSVVNLSRSSYKHLDEMGVTSFKGDLQNPEQIKPALVGVEAVIHTASKVAMWGRWDDFYNINVKGTQNLVHLCKELRIKKMIYTSSPSVVFGDQSLEGVNESVKYPKDSYLSLVHI